MLKNYIALTKPGIIFGNTVTAIGGFMLASKGNIDWMLFFATLLGLSLIIASACVFNNYIDRHLDEKMSRTKLRPLVTGVISRRNALIFGLILGLAGTAVLSFDTNALTVFLALFGLFVYVMVYSLSKPVTKYGTLIGSIAGAMPPVVGYCAVSNCFDLGAFIIFMIVALWQMPHFFAIAMYRLSDYEAASIPVLPIEEGIKATKIQMLFYIIFFILSTFALTYFGYTGYLYLSAAALLGFTWLYLSIKGFGAKNDTVWARKMFLFSLVTVMGLCLMISVDTV